MNTAEIDFQIPRKMLPLRRCKKRYRLLKGGRGGAKSEFVCGDYLIEALEEPDRKMGRFVAGQAASNLPYSSLLRQTASFNDPVMREAKTVPAKGEIYKLTERVSAMVTGSDGRRVLAVELKITG